MRSYNTHFLMIATLSLFTPSAFADGTPSVSKPLVTGNLECSSNFETFSLLQSSITPEVRVVDEGTDYTVELKFYDTRVGFTWLTSDVGDERLDMKCTSDLNMRIVLPFWGRLIQKQIVASADMMGDETTANLTVWGNTSNGLTIDVYGIIHDWYPWELAYEEEYNKSESLSACGQIIDLSISSLDEDLKKGNFQGGNGSDTPWMNLTKIRFKFQEVYDLTHCAT